ncbi:Uncharacterized protein PECH_007187 [Penicillium ucsense]|uniref:DUF7703 domain-containing protein n=1 Tax=Penicillium ucsense TaxID=2839758 RepID=A0A8J8WLN2_9EURO|nr:Uncharacterized protein PECM_000796 [Penicillium ucsense]KAF7735117.1 Uncharacterized protein PECH_007187 [Penicillium ucsense]
MDEVVITLPPEAGKVLSQNMWILQVVALLAIGSYNALEVIIVVFDTFVRYRGLYFWSIQISSWGILLHTLSSMVRLVSPSPNLSTTIVFMIGWYAMVTGQALVLYSRLHLVVPDITKLRWVLYMIIVNAIILHVPMTVLVFCLFSEQLHFARAAAIFDRIQLAGFCIQDFVICMIYIREACRTLGLIFEIRGKQGRRVIIHLIWVNVFVLVLNGLLLVAEYNFHYMEVGLKVAVYSIKLKLEFSVLNRLRSLTHARPCVCQRPSPAPDRSRPSRSSSEFGLYSLISSRARWPRADIEEASAFAHTGGSSSPQRAHSLGHSSSTQDFHEALRETSVNDNTITHVETCILSDSTLSSEPRARGRLEPSTSRYTAEIELLVTPRTR